MAALACPEGWTFNGKGQFQRAHALSDRPELFYNFALCYQQLGDLNNAALYLRRYLDEVPNIENRDQLERRHGNLLERIASRDAGTSPPAGAEAEPPRQPSLQTRQGAEPAAAAAAEPTAAGRGVPVGAVVGFSVAGVGAAVAVTLGALALRERGSIEDGCGANRSCSSGEVQRMDGLALGADIGLAVLVAGATVGTILLLTGRGGDDTEASDDHARLRLAPYAGRTGAGAMLQGRF